MNNAIKAVKIILYINVTHLLYDDGMIILQIVTEIGMFVRCDFAPGLLLRLIHSIFQTLL